MALLDYVRDEHVISDLSARARAGAADECASCEDAFVARFGTRVVLKVDGDRARVEQWDNVETATARYLSVKGAYIGA